MSTFSELLNKPLPSATKSFFESAEEPEDLNLDTEKDTAEECGGSDLLNSMNTVMDCNPGEPCPPPANPVAPVDNPMMANTSDNADVVPNTTPLTPEQSQRVDDIMNVAGTQALLQSELNDEELREFVESVESDIVCGEGFLTEKTIVKFDKNAKKAQLYETAVAAVAREHNDPLFKKLQTVYKMERVLKAKLRKKYNAEATKKVKEYLARAKKSKSSILARIVNKITGK